MSSDPAEFYRLYAAQCVTLARDSADAGRKATLLNMAQAWLVLVDLAYKGKMLERVVQEQQPDRG